MSWLTDMNRDAVSIAFPGFELEPGDRVEIAGDWEDAWAYSSYTSGDAEWEFRINVWRRSGLLANEVLVQYRDFSNSSAAEFWKQLMALGTKAEEDEREMARVVRTLGRIP